jgi:aldose 1-epimerase
MLAVPTISKQNWGSTASGEEIDLYTLRNENGLEATIITFGGRLVTLKTPDRDNRFDDIVLGFDSLDPYLVKNPFFGALVGRYANRIANGEFILDGHKYLLAKNNGPNSLHGGLIGFDKVKWDAQPDNATNSLTLRYLSKDGEEGYPGNLEVIATYTLADNDSLGVDYKAHTDKPTVLNLTNHSYFNLAGQAHGTVIDHLVMINADYFTPVNEHLIPTGDLSPVEGTPFDFRSMHRVSDHIDSQNEQILLGKGYDHNYVINNPDSGLRLAARAMHPGSGRVMEVHTTQPGVQFYTGNHLPDKLNGKNGAVYGFRAGFCFETQHFPDSPNQPSFPTVVLQPGVEYHQKTLFRFSKESVGV